MSKHKSHKNNRTNKTTIIINTSRKAGPQIEIQKHFTINKHSSNKINKGIQTFPFVGDLTQNEIQKENICNIRSTSSFSKSETLLPTLDFDSQFDFLKDDNVIDKIGSSNKELDNKHFSAYDNLSKRKFESNNVCSVSSLKTPTNTPTSKSYLDTLNKVGNVKANVPYTHRSSVRFQTTNNDAKLHKTCSDSAINIDDPSVELKNEIMQYRQSIKNKVLDEKMERKLEELYKINQHEVQVVDGSSDWISTQPVTGRSTVPVHHHHKTCPRLEITLRFLATGESYRSLMYSTRVHETTISRFIPEVCEAICIHLRSEYLKTPTSSAEWLEISDNFNGMWQFPHCLGALDGRHINFRAPRSDGSYFYNYKNAHSIVLLAVADATYKFLYVNIGCNGRVSDGGVFRASELSKAITDNRLNFPPASPLPGRTLTVPYLIVADDAFPLSNRLMKPYPQRGLTHEMRIFNYRLSRARRIIENAFGILANRFRVLLNPIGLSAQKVETITLACVVLHNFLVTHNHISYTDVTSQEITQNSLKKINRQPGNRCTSTAFKIREEFKNFFSSTGSVPWQETAILRSNM